MAFPDTPVPLIGELFIDGAWVDITTDVRGGGNQVRIERGKRDVQGAASPTSANWTQDNRAGTWTDDNPMSPYYGLLPLYMPVRFRLTGQESYLFTSGFDNPDYVRTADKAQLDITGDIDVRAEVEPFAWQSAAVGTATTTVIALMTKTGDLVNQYSWYFGLTADGRIYFSWSATGLLADAKAVASTALPGTTDRLAVRATLDVDNGAGGFTARFYTAPDIAGAWTLLSTSTVAGVTSIFSGTGELQIGAANGDVGFGGAGRMWGGRVYIAQVYNSAAAKVAEADFRSRTIDTTSFSDGLGNTWDLMGDAIIGNDGVRFWGEVESLPQEWDSTSIENVSRASAFDVLRRLSTDATPLQSPLYQTILRYDPTLYIPGEDGTDATELTNVAPGATVTHTMNVRFQGDAGPSGSDGAWSATSVDTYVRALARTETHSGRVNATWFFKAPNLPVPADGQQLLMYLYQSKGTIRRWYVFITDSTFVVEGYSGDGLIQTVNFSGWGGTFTPTEWTGMNLQLTTSGTVITWVLTWFNVDPLDGSDPTFYVMTASTIAGFVGGNIDAMIVDATAVLDDVSYAHQFITVDPNYQFVSIVMGSAARAWLGEAAGTRFERLCLTAGVPYELEGWADLTAPMGRQRVTKLVDSLQECADADGGLLLGSRRQLGLLFVTQKCIASQLNTVTLSHSASELSSPPRPMADSFGRMNDVTVTRANGGGSSRRVIEDGRYGTDTIGTVPGGASVNVQTDEDTAPVAGFLASVGTWEGKRIENIAVALNRDQTLLGSTKASALLALDPGRYLTITDLPGHQPPDPTEQLVLGYTETISNMTYDLVFTGFPYGPWRNGAFDDLAAADLRFAAAFTTVGTAMNTTVGTLMLDTSGGDPLWATVALYPSMTFNFDIMVGGERMTVTNIVGGATPQTATVTRSVNGIVKSHAVGTPVQLYYVTYFGR